jgi:hypothetical protein
LTLIRKPWFSLRVVCGFFLLAFLLGGCATNPPAKVTEPLVRHSSVHGGQQPVSGSTIRLYAVGTTGDGSPATPLLRQAVTTDANGIFDITGLYTCPSASALVYITATGGNPGLSAGTNNAAIALMAALGPCGSLGPSTFININELTTVAAVWSLAPFMSSYSSIGSGTTDAAGLASAFMLASEYVNTTTGTAPGLNVPAGTTVPVAQLNTLADILSSCVNSAGGVAGDGSACGTLFAAATPSGGAAPVEVIGAGLNIANNPTANVSSLFGLVTATAPFQPMLAAVPADLTVGLAAPTGLSVSADSLTFPAAYLGFPSTQTVTVTNNGATAVAFNGISVTGPAATDYGLVYPTVPPSNFCVSSPGLAAGATCLMPVQFTPSAVGPRNASLLIQSGAINSPVAIPLSGAGLVGSGGPVTLSPSSLTFTLAGVPQLVTVTNLGTTPVPIGNITFSGQPYSILEQTNNCGGTLAAQSICTISVQADSLSPFTYSATMTVTDEAGTQTLPINLPGSINFQSTPINFGSWALGVTTPSQVLQATSGGSGESAPPSFTGSIIGPNASDFAFPSGNSCNSMGLSTCYLYLTFTPSGLGARTATLVTRYGNVPLSGTGIADGPSFTITPGYISAERVGVSSPSSSIAVLNNGSTQVLPSGTSVTGADAGDFAVTNSCTGNFFPASTCFLSVVFTPSQAGLRTATLTITDSISGLSETATLQATANLTVTPPTLTFGNTAVGATSAAQTATISASNGDPITFQALTGSGYVPGDFLLVPGTCATQTPCQVSVTFHPSATGQRSAAYQVNDTVTGELSYLSLSGTGGVATVSLSTSSLTFAARNEGTTSIPQAVTLTNNGDANLTVSGTMFIGANAGDFSLQGNTCGSSLAPGGNCTISVSFSPAASGARSAILQIVSNAASSPDSVQLSGTGN